MSKGLEPYTSSQLQAWLKDKGFQFHHQTGDHVFYARNDLIVPAGGARDLHITAPMAAKLAKDAFGQNAKWLREQLGHSHARRAGNTCTRIPPPPTARGQLINAINSIAHTGHALNRDRACLHAHERATAEIVTIAAQLKRLEQELRKAS